MTHRNEEWISVNAGVHVVGVEISVDMPAYDRFKRLLHQVDAIAVGLELVTPIRFRCASVSPYNFGDDTDRAYISLRHDDQFLYLLYRNRGVGMSSDEENRSMFEHTSDLFNNGAIVSFSWKSSVIHDS